MLAREISGAPLDAASRVPRHRPSAVAAARSFLPSDRGGRPSLDSRFRGGAGNRLSQHSFRHTSLG